jgi:hypothetical protein
MHGHSTLMLAAVGLVAAFVPIVVTARWLEAAGRLGDPERIIPFDTYGPIIAGVLSLGTAAIHLTVIGDHAIRSSPTSDPVLFLCAVGVATAHPTGVEPALLGFLPLGVVSLAAVPLQGVWALPRLWRDRPAATIGAAIAVVSLGLSAAQVGLGAAVVDPTPGVGNVGTIALVGEGLFLVGIAALVLGRPRRFVEGLDARMVDASIATALAVVGVAMFTVVALLFGRVTH